MKDGAPWANIIFISPKIHCQLAVDGDDLEEFGLEKRASAHRGYAVLTSCSSMQNVAPPPGGVSTELAPPYIATNSPSRATLRSGLPSAAYPPYSRKLMGRLSRSSVLIRQQSRNFALVPECRLNLDGQQRSHSRMVTLAPERLSLTRAVIAGILAWLLAFQGFAFAASPQKHFAPAGVGAEHAISPDGNYCGMPHGGGPSAPCQYDHCCCIARSPIDTGGLAWMTAILWDAAVFSSPRTTGTIAWHVPGSENRPPAGWTSSWSQRAPPRFS